MKVSIRWFILISGSENLLAVSVLTDYLFFPIERACHLEHFAIIAQSC